MLANAMRNIAYELAMAARLENDSREDVEKNTFWQGQMIACKKALQYLTGYYPVVIIEKTRVFVVTNDDESGFLFTI